MVDAGHTPTPNLGAGVGQSAGADEKLYPSRVSTPVSGHSGGLGPVSPSYVPVLRLGVVVGGPTTGLGLPGSESTGKGHEVS